MGFWRHPRIWTGLFNKKFEELNGYDPKPSYPALCYNIGPENDYQEISGLLTNEIRRDFTFVHPAFLLDDKYSVEEGKIKLNNTNNYQEYKVMLLTGCNTISWKTLKKPSGFYKSGGTIIYTTKLPCKSSEMSEDQKVLKMVQEIFGINSLNLEESNIINLPANLPAKQKTVGVYRKNNYIFFPNVLK